MIEKVLQRSLGHSLGTIDSITGLIPVQRVHEQGTEPPAASRGRCFMTPQPWAKGWRLCWGAAEQGTELWRNISIYLNFLFVKD